MPVPGPLGSFALQGAGFTAEGTYDGGPVDLIAACSAGRVCAPGRSYALGSVRERHALCLHDLCSRHDLVGRGRRNVCGIRWGGSLDWRERYPAVAFRNGLSGTRHRRCPLRPVRHAEGLRDSGISEPRLVFEWPLVGHGTATAELLAGPSPSGSGIALTVYRIIYAFD